MQEEEEREREDEGDESRATDDGTAERMSWSRAVSNELFPRLSTGGGGKKCSRGRSVAILSALYCSHVFSAWGDRMWQFLVTILLALLYPGSLLLPGVFGLVFALLPAILGTVLGDFVDRNPRMRVVWVSLLVQNTLVCACSVVLAFLFGLDLGICGDVPLYLFILLSSLVVVLGASANLATVVNTIAMEKDWVVVIADKNKEILASLNANMRRIDLVCKLLSPAFAGVVLQFAGPLTTTILAASWNLVSFFAELGLVVLVYRWVPALANKKMRDYSTLQSANEALIEGEEEEEGEGEEGEGEGEGGDFREGEQVKFREDTEVAPAQKVKGQASSTPPRSTLCSRLLTPYISLKDGWSIYWRQEIALAGLAMATIYLTVLGFSGVTAVFFLTQGLPNAAIGTAQGVGAIFGVTGTIAYPYIRRKVGTVRTGMFGISSQLAMLLLCLVAVVIPAERVENTSEGYYSPHCPAGNGTSEIPAPFCSGYLVTTTSLLTPSHSPLPTFLPTPSPTPSPTPAAASGSGSGDLRPIRAAEADPRGNLLLTSPTPTPTCTISAPPSGSKVEWNVDRLLPLGLMLGGVILARFGLWIFDLAVQQRVQETVPEEMRGAVGGVMSAMNSVMDMMHYVLVIAAPRPEHFSILTFISVGMVTLGAVLYAVYLRRIRGHFFHCRQWWEVCRSWLGRGGQGQVRYRQVQAVNSEEQQNFLVNEDVL